MGVLSDSFRARLDEMRERHAQTDREIAVHRDRCFELLAEIQVISRDLEEVANRERIVNVISYYSLLYITSRQKRMFS